MSRRMYFWIAAKDETGKPYLISATMCSTESEVRQRGIEMLGGLDFEIKRYPTRDLSSAVRMHRGSRLEDTHALRTSARRQGHEKSIARLHRRMSRRDGL